MRALTIGRRTWTKIDATEAEGHHAYGNGTDDAVVVRRGPGSWDLYMGPEDDARRTFATLRAATAEAERIAPTTEAAPVCTFVGPDVYGYARRSAYRAVGSIPGADWEGTAHDLIADMLADGTDTRELTADVRNRIMWDAKSARRDAIRAARIAGDEPSERAAAGGIATGAVGPALHHLDIIGTAWDVLAARDPEAYRWAVVASYGVPKRGGLSTVHVVPFANSRDRDTRAGVVSRALAMLGAAYDDVMAEARARGVRVVTEHEGVGAPRSATVRPLIDVPTLARWYGWDDETREGAALVSGALSPRDQAAQYVNHDGPAGSTVPARAPRANTGAKGRSGALSGAPGAGTVAGSGSQVGGARRERLTAERPHREARDAVERFALSGDVTAPRPLSPEAEARAEAEAARAEALARAAHTTWGRDAEAEAVRVLAALSERARSGAFTPEALAAQAARDAEAEAARAAEAARNAEARAARAADWARSAYGPYRPAARAARRARLIRAARAAQ